MEENFEELQNYVKKLIVLNICIWLEKYIRFLIGE